MAWRRVWVWKRKLKTRTSFYLRWYDEQGWVRSESVGTDSKLAEGLRRKREFELNEGLFNAPRQIRLSGFADEHLRLMANRLAESTRVGRRKVLELFQEAVGDKRLVDIEARHVEDYLAQRLEERSAATVNKELRVLKAVFSHAVRRGYLRDSPCRHAGLLREAETEKRVLSVQEVERLFVACADAELRVFVFVALTTGMRREEIVALEWDDVDLEGATITVRNKPTHLTKNRRERVQPLVSEAVEMLREWQKDHEGARLFASRDGEQVGPAMLRRFKQMTRAAGIGECTLHDLRRSFVSHLAMAGIGAQTVRRLVGHASIATTDRYYTHILPDTLRQAARQLPYVAIVSQSYHAESESSGTKSAAS